MLVNWYLKSGGISDFMSFEPFMPVITPLGVVDTVCLPVIPAEWYYFVENIVFANLTAAPLTLDLHLRPSGAPAGAGNQICSGLSIPANTIYQNPIGPLTIPPGWVLSGRASLAAGVNITLSGRLCIMPPPDARRS